MMYSRLSEAGLAAKVKPVSQPMKVEMHYSSDNANEAMRLLGIADHDQEFGGRRWKLSTWAAQAALSRPGRRKLEDKDIKDITTFTFDSHKLRWPKGARGGE